MVKYPYEKYCESNVVLIDCVADLHGCYPNLGTGGDLLIIAGDITASDEYEEYVVFKEWLRHQKYSRKILVGGNHDNWIQNHQMLEDFFGDTDYLCDSGTIFDGIRIWGSPWTKTFANLNPRCRAFCLETEEELAEKFKLIPEETDILVTHGPPRNIGDRLALSKTNVGSTSLRDRVEKTKPLYHIYGHIHECRGVVRNESTTFINCSHVNEKYVPYRKTMRIEF